MKPVISEFLSCWDSKGEYFSALQFHLGSGHLEADIGWLETF